MQSLYELNYTELAERPFEMILKHPETGDPLIDEETGEKMYLMVYGVDSDRYTAAFKEQIISRTIYEEGMKDENGVINKTTDSLMAKSEFVEESELKKLAAVIDSGKLLGIDPKKPNEWTDVTPNNAIDILRKIKWIPQQVEAAILDRKNLVRDHKKK